MMEKEILASTKVFLGRSFIVRIAPLPLFFSISPQRGPCAKT